MQTLSYGYLKPSNPDTGDEWFPALESNIQQLNDHNHDGSNSAFIASVVANILSAAWVSVANGIYRQAITVPTGMNYDTCHIQFRLSTGQFVYPDVERISTTQYYVYTNDNSVAYKALYK